MLEKDKGKKAHKKRTHKTKDKKRPTKGKAQ
jgi:hypothetical protein